MAPPPDGDPDPDPNDDGDNGGPTEEPPIALQLYASGFFQPLFVGSPPGDLHRLFVVERTGKIWIIKDGDRLYTPFLDVSTLVQTAAFEQGLLGLAFHPQYAQNGFFYIGYTELDGTVVLARYSRSQAKPNEADPATAKILLRVPQPRANHNGGMVAFGPDGYLYFAPGDGGTSAGPQNTAQMLTTLLGKMLRLDVDNGDPYAIPPDNPFVNDPNALGEIWAYGLRNPWRWSFDSDTGDLYIADVGQSHREELNFQPASSAGGQNYGWYTAEGFACLGGGGNCGTNDGFTPPILDLTRDLAQSITGGYVYRGIAMPGLHGTYFFGDFMSKRIWSLKYDGTTISNYLDRTTELAPPAGLTIASIASFGEDGFGEIYFCDLLQGRIYKIVQAEPES